MINIKIICDNICNKRVDLLPLYCCQSDNYTVGC